MSNPKKQVTLPLRPPLNRKETTQKSRDERPLPEDDKYSRSSRDPDDPIFDYDDEDLEGSRFDPDCEDDPM